MSVTRSALAVMASSMVLLSGMQSISIKDADLPSVAEVGGSDAGLALGSESADEGETGPYIIMTQPSNLQTNVTLDAQILIKFSTAMERSPPGYFVKEYDGVSWINVTLMPTVSWLNETTLTVDHMVDFMPCRPYKMRIRARDSVGTPLNESPVIPNPFRFQTAGKGSETCSLYMSFTSPSSEQLNVSSSQNVTIVWHHDPDAPEGGINTSSFAFRVTNSSMGDITGNFTAQWSGPGQNTVELSHPALPFEMCEMYGVEILSLMDNADRAFIPGMIENPLRFRTDNASCPPYVLETSPHDDEWGVELYRDITIRFSKPMNTSISFTLSPIAAPLNPAWSENDTYVRITHAILGMCTFYTAEVWGRDKEGNSLTMAFAPSQWTFLTVAPCHISIVNGSPFGGTGGASLDEPIKVTFDDLAERASLEIWLSPYNGRFSVTWIDDENVRIDHTTPFSKCTTYTVRIDVISKNHDPLLPGPFPNPWNFQSICDPLYVVYTDPPDGAIDVPLWHPITIGFSESIDITTFLFMITPSHGAYTMWFPNSQTAIVSATLSIPCTVYYVTVDVHGLDGDVLPIPYSFHFTTVCTQSPTGLQVHRLPPNDVLLSWVPIPNAPYYEVFHSVEKSAPWPWPEIAQVFSNSAVIPGHLSDGSNHFYIVRANGGSGGNSTMGVLLNMHFTHSPVEYGGRWISLPYNTVYRRASDIAEELGPGKIDAVAKLDADRQRMIVYYRFRGQWRGPDFPIDAGEGLLVGSVVDLDWSINGTDRDTTLAFTFNPIRSTHYYLVSLPYTGSYDAASRLVMAIAGGLGPGTDSGIVSVGMWNHSAWSYDVFCYTPLGWGGVDFKLDTGEGVWIEITSNFAWTPSLLTPEVP